MWRSRRACSALVRALLHTLAVYCTITSEEIRDHIFCSIIHLKMQVGHIYIRIRFRDCQNIQPAS